VLTALTVQSVSLCVEVMPLESSSEAGQVATWSVAAWAEGGNVAAATVRLEASPNGAGTPGFSSGCGHSDGTGTCTLGPVEESAAARQLQAQVTIPSTTTASAVELTATISAASLPTKPRASGSVTILAPASAVGASDPTVPALSPVGVSAPTPLTTLSPGGSASGLFPAVAPSSGSAAPPPGPEYAAPAANTSALPAGSDPVGAQIAGLAALALAFFFAVTRVSLRWRWSARPAAPGETAAREAGGEPDRPAGGDDKEAPGPSSPDGG
jgi:hypothetical protein